MIFIKESDLEQFVKVMRTPRCMEVFKLLSRKKMTILEMQKATGMKRPQLYFYLKNLIRIGILKYGEIAEKGKKFKYYERNTDYNKMPNLGELKLGNFKLVAYENKEV